jgi:hypothetical protein
MSPGCNCEKALMLQNQLRPDIASPLEGQLIAR